MKKNSPWNDVPEPKGFFNEIEDWRKHWKGMPEYESTRQREFHSITVRFSNERDMNEFSKLVEQTITKVTKSIWFPKFQRVIKKKYIEDES